MLDQNGHFKSVLDLFVPMISSLFRKRKIGSISQSETQKVIDWFYEEYGLRIPVHPMISILNRMQDLGILKTTKGYFYYVSNQNSFQVDQTEFELSSTKFDLEFEEIIRDYQEFALTKHGKTLTKEEAYNHILLILDDHDLDLAFVNQNPSSAFSDSINQSVINKNLFYDFIKNIFEEKSPKFDVIHDVVFGHIIASAMFYTNIRPLSIKDSKTETHYYLDTGILFGLFGLNGEYELSGYQEFIQLLIDSGGKVKLFEHTYQEFVNIIESCGEWIDSPSFTETKASRALRTFRDLGYHRSDIDLFIKRLPEKIDSLEISIEEIPNPNVDKRFQIDEQEFQDQLISIYQQKNPYFNVEEKEDTIEYDVKSVSAVFKQRRGRVPRNLSECKVVFVTRNPTLAYASKLHENTYPHHDSFYIPTVVTDVFLGTILWLSSPIDVKFQDYSKKHLIANIYAALNPTKQHFNLFLNEVNKLKIDGSLTEDEVIFLRTSSLARELLQESTLGDPNKITPKTPSEILDQIRNEERLKAQQEFDQKERFLKNENEALREKLLQQEEENRKKENDILEKDQNNQNLMDKLEKEIKQKINRWAWSILGLIIFIITFLFLVSEKLIPLEIDPQIVLFAQVITIGIGIISLVFNINLRDMKDNLVNRLVNKKIAKES